MPGLFPKQKISKAQKDADDKQWYKDNGVYIIDQASFFSDDRWEMIQLYEAAAGYINKDTYKYVLNPYNTTDENLKNFPARLRNYDNIIPILNLFLGEKGSAPFNHEVMVSNPDTPNKNKDDVDKAFAAAMAQHFVNFLNDQGVQTGVDSQQIPPYEKLLKNYQVDASEKRVIFGQEALDFLKHELSLKDAYLEAYYDWLVIGRVVTYKDIYKNDVLFSVVPPLEFWHGPTKSGFIEDANWCYRRSRFNLNDVIDRFHEVLTPDEIDTLEQKYRSNDGLATSNITTMINIDSQVDNTMSNNNTLFNETRGLMEVHHMTWKGFRKVGFLQYMDQMGGMQEMEVSEDYTLNKENGDIKLEWHYLSETYEIYRLGDTDGFYKYPRPLQVQRQELSNTSICKQPYNGRAGYTERNKITSIVKQCLPYASLINIWYYRMELIIAKNKEKMMTLPLGLIPNKPGWTEDRFFYYGETTGILFVDETNPNTVNALNAIKGIDMSLGNYITEMRNLIISTKQDMWDAIGMNRQRYGDINSSDGKGNNEQAIIRSSTISREMNRRFERFIETDLQGLIECSKLAWIDGKKGAYINSEGKKAFMDLDGSKHADTDYGIFAVDSDEERDKLKTARQYAFGLAQKQGTPASTFLDILDINSMSKMKAAVRKAEEIQQEYEQSVSEAEQEHEKAVEEMAAQQKNSDNQTSIQKAQITADASIQVALIQAGSNANTKEQPDLDGAYDDYVKKMKDDDLKKQREGLGAYGKVADDRMREAKLAMEKQKMESAEKIAKMNKG